MTRYQLTTEVFSLPHERGHLVYAPLLQTTVVVNDAALSLLADIAAARSVARDERTGQVLALFEELNLISDTGAAPAAASAAPPRPACTTATPVRPTDVTLFLTTDCNLRCIYCYASGGERPRYLDPATAMDAIDLVVANAVAAGETQVRVSFHGGGEPTLAARTMQRCVEYARRRCAEHDLQLFTGTATNGVMSDATRDYLAETMTSVMVSVDGPPEVQDRQRPQADGGPSSAGVARTLARLSRSEVTLGVRLTCTADALDHAVATTRQLADSYRLKTIHLEPLFVCGRSIGTELAAPDPERFIEVFRACRDEAGRRGVELAYSGARQSLSCTFCQASKPSFNVTTEGDVTACYEVTGRDDPRAATFVYGAHDPARHAFSFDETRVAALRRLTVTEAPRCARCFAKYHCAGDCPSKRLHDGSDAAVIARCEINRRLTRDQLEEVIRCQTTSQTALTA